MTRSPTLRLTLLALALGLTAPALAGGVSKHLQGKLKTYLKECGELPPEADSDEKCCKFAGQTIAEIGALDNDDAAELLVKVGSGWSAKSAAAEVHIAESAMAAIGAMKSPDAHKWLGEALGKKKGPVVTFIARAIHPIAAEDPIQFGLHKALAKKRQTEPALVEIARALAASKDKRAVKPLIEAYGVWQDKGGVPLEEIREALAALTGKRFYRVKDWQEFWDPREATFNPKTAPKAPPRGSTVEREARRKFGSKPPELFGEEVLSKRVVIILDVSSSMAAKDAGGVKGKDFYDGPTVEPDDRGYGTIPESRMRLERAKAQLRGLVNAWDASTRFNLIKFSTVADAWQFKKIVPANGSNKNDGLRWINNLNFGGVTQIYEAILLAFKTRDADTFYLISDGTPTDQGGKPLSPGKKYEMLTKVKQLNKLRRIKIHTIGLKGANANFLRELSKMTGGNFRQVG